MGIKIKDIKGIFNGDEDEKSDNEYYHITSDEALKTGGEGTKLILLEPRAYSESQQIADHLKNRHTVVVNLKRVTKDQAKRIVDFLSGTIYALGGDLQKIGNGIFVCTPNNINVQGKITNDEEGSKKDDIDLEF